MPNVPRVDLPTSLNQKAIPSVDLTTPTRGSDFAGNMAQGIKEALPDVERYMAGVKEKADQDAVLKAHTQLTQWQQQNIFAPKDQNPQAALNQEGEAAANLTPRVTKDWDKFTAQIRSGLANDDQVREFDRKLAAENEHVFSTLATHERKQYEAVSQGVYKESVDAQVNAAWNAFSEDRGLDTEALQKTLATGVAVVNQRALSYSWPKEVREAEIKSFTSRALTGVITSIRDVNPGEALVMFNSNRDKLDFTQPGVKDLETGLRATAMKAQALALVASLSRQKLGPEEQLAKLNEMELVEKPQYRPEVTEHAKQLVELKLKQTEALKDIADKNTFEVGRNKIAANPWSWSPATSPEHQVLTSRGSAYASHLDDYARTLRRTNSSDASERRLQKAIDTQYLSGIKRDLSLDDPNAMDVKKHEDPAYQLSLTKGRGMPSPEAVATGQAIAGRSNKRGDEMSKVSRMQFVSELYATASTIDYLQTPEDKKNFVSQAATLYDSWRANNQNRIPDAETTNQIKSIVTLKMRTDPEASYFTGDMLYTEAMTQGLLKKAEPLPTSEQVDPTKKYSATPPVLPSGAKPGHTIVRKGNLRGQVPTKDVQKWLQTNEGWSY